VVLLRLILSPNVLPPSVDALNRTSSTPVLLVHYATAGGAKRSIPVAPLGVYCGWAVIDIVAIPRVFIMITPKMILDSLETYELSIVKQRLPYFL
jgi:hypothetical protein